MDELIRELETIENRYAANEAIRAELAGVRQRIARHLSIGAAEYTTRGLRNVPAPERSYTINKGCRPIW